MIRINLNKKEYSELIKKISNLNLSESLEWKIKNAKEFDTSKKQLATKNANKAKIEKSKEKIQNAINMLQLEGREINAKNIALTAGMSIITVKKYMKHITSSEDDGYRKTRK